MSDKEVPEGSPKPETPQARVERTLPEYLKDWTPAAADLDSLLPLGRESLETVTALTEYEDGKAGRVLTAIALLSAVAGSIYASMVKDVVPALPAQDGLIFNGSFFLYAGVNGIGVFLLVRAIYPWFNVKIDWRKKNRSPNPPKSMIFGPLIAEVTPEAWGKAFDETSTNLKIKYLKNYVHETYLIAEKILRKHRRLRNALWFIAIGNAFLLPLWLGYSVYLNMKRGMQPATPIPEVRNTESEDSDYSCFVVLDADNTLWDTDRLFADAQLAMLNDICSQIGITPNLNDPLRFVRNIDESIAASHPAGLKYPPELLAEGLITALLKDSGKKEKSPKDRKARTRKAADTYLSKIREIPKLRAGVPEGLRNLRKLGARTVICSEGVNESLLRNLNELGVLSYVDKLVVASKSSEVYRHLSDEFNPLRKLQLSVGDQLDRDIQYAKSAGYKTVYFPGNFQPTWLPKLSAIRPDVTIDSFAFLPDHVRTMKKAWKTENVTATGK